MNSKSRYFIRAFARLAVPPFVLRIKERRLLDDYAKRTDRQEIDDRVNYYCQLTGGERLPNDAPSLAEQTYHRRLGPSVYFFDTQEFTRYFPKSLHWLHVPGDIRSLCDAPTIVKTRPLDMNDSRFKNSVLMKLDKVRHFFFVNDPVPFAEKKKVVVFRGAVHNEQRWRFVESFKGKAGFDVCSTNKDAPPSMRGERLTLRRHLDCRYIMSLEGNDVATNLKWLMSSDSIAVMPRPTVESWFMEGRLVPDYHYIETKPDFSDLEERIAYYNAHEDEATAIVRHAHEWVAQFRDPHREEIISYLVLRKYFRKTVCDGATQLD